MPDQEFHTINMSEPSLRDAFDYVKATGVTLDNAPEAISEEDGLTERAILLVAGMVWLSERRHRPGMTLEEAYDAPLTMDILSGEAELPTQPT